MHNQTLCIYHADCLDGFAAAWVVRKALGENVQFYAAAYGTPPPDVTGRMVYMVDFTYPREAMIAMAQVANRMVVIDHHKTARAALGDLPANVTTVFDEQYSGAMLTWEHFFPGSPAPDVLRHVEDYDLWRFRLHGTREVNAALASYPFDFGVWDRLMDCRSELLTDGVPILRKLHQDVAALVPLLRQRITLAGYDVPAANVVPTLRNEIGDELAKGEPFAVVYWDTADGRRVSLRSSDAGVDVSVIAASFGGGGHRNAASFRLPTTDAWVPLAKPMTNGEDK